MQSNARVGLLMSEGGCTVGGVGVRVCGEEGVEDSRTGRSALPGTGLHTPSSSLPGEQKEKKLKDDLLSSRKKPLLLFPFLGRRGSYMSRQTDRLTQ